MFWIKSSIKIEDQFFMEQDQQMDHGNPGITN